MTLSIDHEDILEAIRACWSECFINGDRRDSESLLCMVDTALFRTIYKCPNFPLRADAYLDPEDGGGPIMVEVGTMKDGKWSQFISSDGEPVRVLRVGFDYSISMINPRSTKRENKFLAFLRQNLKDM